VRETKTFLEPAELKADFGGRIIEGYAATFNNVDLVGDIVAPGAFTKTIAERQPRKLIKVFLDHAIPIGMPLEMVEDSRGLFTRSRISEVPEGDKALQFVKDGLCAHMSFAYDVMTREMVQQESREPIRRLLELKLYEFGPVHWPANEQAEILGLKELSEALQEAKAKVPDLRALLAKKGYLRDGEIDLVQHLGAAITKAMTEAITALAEREPERPKGDEPAAPATTPPAGPQPQKTAVDPEDKAYLGEVGVRLAALELDLATARIRAAAL
jgi:HK97 family phage prohead protease